MLSKISQRKFKVNELHEVHAFLFSGIHGHEYLFYAFVCVFPSHDLVSTYLMLYETKLKKNQLWELMFSKPLKLNLCMFTFL